MMMMNFRVWISYRLGSSLLSAWPFALSSGVDDGADEDDAHAGIELRHPSSVPGTQQGETFDRLKCNGWLLLSEKWKQNCTRQKHVYTDEYAQTVQSERISPIIAVMMSYVESTANQVCAILPPILPELAMIVAFGLLNLVIAIGQMLILVALHCCPSANTEGIDLD